MFDQPRRFFACRFCDHKLRFGAKLCSACHQPTQLANRRPVWFGTALAVVLAAGLGLLLSAL